MTTLEKNALKSIYSNLNKDTNIGFTNGYFEFYDDTCGQREHTVEVYKGYGLKKVPGCFRVIRKLSFTNEVDKGKDGAILGILDVTRATLVSLSEDKVVYKEFTINFK